MKKIKGILAILVLAVLVASAGYYKYNDSKPSEAKKTTLKIAYLPITHALPLFKAKEMLEEENANVQIELIKYGGWSELMDALNSGRVDGASVLIELAMKSVEQGIDLQLLDLGHRDGNVVIAGDSIKKATDVVGKTLAIPSKQSSHYLLLKELMKQNNISEDQVTFIEMAPTEMPYALQSEQIDGYCVAEPFGAKAVAEGIGHVLIQSEDLWEDSICCGIVINQSAKDKGNDAVSIFKKTYEKAGNSLTKEESKEIAVKYLGQKEAIADTSLAWISFDNLQVTEAAYKSLSEKIIEQGLSEKPPTYEEFVY